MTAIVAGSGWVWSTAILTALLGVVSCRLVRVSRRLDALLVSLPVEDVAEPGWDADFHAGRAGAYEGSQW